LVATVNVTVPLSTPPGPDVIEIHDTLLTAVHVQVATVPNDTDVPVDPGAGTVIVDGVMVKEHACETVTV
jgi:hypothetical protein